MADGTYTRTRSVAMNRHPLGTKIKLLGLYVNGRRVASTVRGLKVFVVRDRIGWGTELDFWSPSCSWSRYFGRKTARYQIIR